MARQGISEQQVIDAAEALAQEGQAVTVSAVRDRIGSGSYSTINDYLGKWREASAGRKTDGAPDMPESVGRAMRQLWAAAWKEAQDGIRTEREALETARRDMERERRDMTAEIARLETENTAQNETIHRLTDNLATKDEAIALKERQAHALQIENTRLETENAARGETISRLEADNQAKAETIAALSNNLTVKSEALANAEKQNQALSIHNAAKDETIKRLETEKVTQSEMIHRLTDNLNAKIEALADAEKVAQSLRIENARLDEQEKAAEARAADLRGELDKLLIFRETPEKTEPTKTKSQRSAAKPSGKSSE